MKHNPLLPRLNWTWGDRHWLLAGISFGLSLILSAIPAWASGSTPPAPPPTPIQIGHQSDIPRQDHVLAPSLAAAQQLDQAGYQHFDAGDFATAAQHWHQAAQAYEQQEDWAAQAQSLSNLALAYQRSQQPSQAQAAIAQSLALLDRLEQRPERSIAATTHLRARILTSQGSLQLSQDPAAALKTWTAAEAAYQKVADNPGQWLSQLNQAQALQELGFYPRALKQLSGTLSQLHQQSSSDPQSKNLEIQALRRLASLHRLAGSLNQSAELLQQSLELAQRQQPISSTTLSEILLEQGKTAQAQGKLSQAIAHYDRAQAELGRAAQPKSPQGFRIQQAKLQTLMLMQDWPAASQQWPQILAQRPSPSQTEADLDLAALLLRLGNEAQTSVNHPQRWSAIAQLLPPALSQAQAEKNRRSEAIALGLLGELSEQQSQWADAQRLTQSALMLSQQLGASELSYRWQWQLGRILKQRGHRDEAIATYASAINLLDSFKDDWIRLNPDVQLSFRSDIDPVYRQYIDLLLSTDSQQTTLEQAQNLAQTGLRPKDLPSNHLGQAQLALEQLHQLELGSFLGVPCDLGSMADTQTPGLVQISQVDPRAAIVMPIMLADRLEMLIQLPNGHLQHYASAVEQHTLEKMLQQFRYYLVVRSRDNYLSIAQKLYDLMVQPLETTLAENQIQTLVFSLDSSLNAIPMAALHDGQRYLIERYQVVIAPGLTLKDPQPMRKASPTLAVGLSEAREGFAALPHVAAEMAAIARHVPQSEVLINQDFTEVGLRDRINPSQFPIVHIATHGQFSSDPADTFLLAWNSPIPVRTLDQMFQTRADRAIELLVLSACQTAVGDRRAALGIAGVAIQAGARSTLATLWAVDDQATAQLMDSFYAALPQMSRAEALRQAQLTLLQDPKHTHPIYWAPYILLGNWL